MVIHKSKNVMHHTNRIKDKIHMIILLNEENILIKFNIPSQSLKYDSKFLYSCEHLKTNKCVLPNYSGGTGMGQIFPFQKREIRKKRAVIDTEQV